MRFVGTHGAGGRFKGCGRIVKDPKPS
jgi:hypothetical protein